MRNFEVTFIVDPVLSGDEIKSTATTYTDQLKSLGAEIVHVDEMGLRQLAYTINRRTTGIYYSVEFSVPTGDLINKIELAMRRDERIMRFLTVKLDKYGVKYNEDKRKGLIGTVSKKKSKGGKSNSSNSRGNNRSNSRGKDRPNSKERAPKEESNAKEGSEAKKE
ncbi:MAG: 30S ribosomal protein S6 [Bacteroidota bacterium]